MGNSDSTDFDNLSKLANELKEIEGREGGVQDPARADEVREGLIAAMRGVYKSHYDFAVRLDRYHGLYKEKKTSTAAMEKIAAASGCSSRTLYRLLKNYHDAKQLPLIFTDVLQQEGIDPVVGKNQPLVKALIEAPKPATSDQAKASLTAARAKVVEIKRAAQTTPNDLGESRPAVQSLATTPEAEHRKQARVSPPAARSKVVKSAPPVQTTSNDVEDFAARIVQMFEAQYGSYQGADRDEQIRAVLERVLNVLGVDVHELRIDNRPDCVRKPARSNP